MDARRFANAQGLTMKGPRRIYDAFYASAGMLFAQRHGLFRRYHDTVFRKFWNHELEIDELAEIAGVITAVGGSADAFEAYVRGPARAEHDRIIDEAEALGVLRRAQHGVQRRAVLGRRPHRHADRAHRAAGEVLESCVPVTRLAI
ncbi:DsbA family protein, partial [Bradyrhizobium sp. 13971]